MNKLTYKQSYDKIIDAYFKDEIQPFSLKFCFCGTLCNGSGWYHGVTFPEVNEHFPHSGYTGADLGRMEYELLKTVWPINECDKEWEQALFDGMSAALDVLKQIHIERGDIIDEPQSQFKKRELVKP